MRRGFAELIGRLRRAFRSAAGARLGRAGRRLFTVSRRLSFDFGRG